MAERRMFSRSIVESDPFMDMPPEAQMLYIRLNLNADDDGFCDNPRAIMRACGASNDSMKLLIAKKFVLAFEKKDNFIVVIKHWRINNYIRKDNYRETKYKEFMKELYYDENRAYSLNPGDGHKPCLPPVDASYTGRTQTVDVSLTQDRIGKDSKGKVSLDQDSSGKRESEGGNPPPEAALIPDAEKRKERIAFWKKRVAFMQERSYPADGMYNLAASEGITREEIDGA